MAHSKLVKKHETLILTHGDSDGVCCGAIAKCAYPESDVYFTSPVGVVDDLRVADDYKNIIICDIAIDERLCSNLYERLGELAENSNMFYIDHHPLPGKCIDVDWLYHDTNVCASELTYKVLEKRLNRDMRRVAIYGAIGDYYNDTPSIKKWTLDWDMRSLYFQAGTLIQALIFAGRDYDFKRKLLYPLSRNIIPSEIHDILHFAQMGSKLEENLRHRIKKQVKTLDNIAYVVDPKGYMSKSAIYAASSGMKDVGLAAEYRHRKHVYDMSLRSRDTADLNMILREVAPKFGGNGGGHASAAGARIPRESFEDFLRELDKAISREKHNIRLIKNGEK